MCDIKEFVSLKNQNLKLMSALDEVVSILKPSRERPCDCEPLRCYCANTGDAVDVAMWDADNYVYGLIVGIRDLAITA